MLSQYAGELIDGQPWYSCNDSILFPFLLSTAVSQYNGPEDRCRNVIKNQFHKDKLRHLPRFPDFFVTSSWFSLHSWPVGGRNIGNLMLIHVYGGVRMKAAKKKKEAFVRPLETIVRPLEIHLSGGLLTRFIGRTFQETVVNAWQMLQWRDRKPGTRSYRFRDLILDWALPLTRHQSQAKERSLLWFASSCLLKKRLWRKFLWITGITVPQIENKSNS